MYNSFFIPEGFTLTGHIDGTVPGRIEGTVIGDIYMKGFKVIVSETGFVQGSIYAADIIIGGKVKGDIYAEKSAVIEEHGEITGDICSSEMYIHPNTKIGGNIKKTGKDGKVIETIYQTDQHQKKEYLVTEKNNENSWW